MEISQHLLISDADECHGGKRGSRIFDMAPAFIEAGLIVVYPASHPIEADAEATMNVKISIELPEQQVEFAERKMRDGGYSSVSEVISELLRDNMLTEPGKVAGDPLLAMKDEIRRRLELPDDQWLSEDDFWKGFEERREVRRRK